MAKLSWVSDLITALNLQDVTWNVQEASSETSFKSRCAALRQVEIWSNSEGPGRENPFSKFSFLARYGDIILRKDKTDWLNYTYPGFSFLVCFWKKVIGLILSSIFAAVQLNSKIISPKKIFTAKCYLIISSGNGESVNSFQRNIKGACMPLPFHIRHYPTQCAITWLSVYWQYTALLSVYWTRAASCIDEKLSGKNPPKYCTVFCYSILTCYGYGVGLVIK